MTRILIILFAVVAYQQQLLPLSKQLKLAIDQSKIYTIQLPQTIQSSSNLFITTTPIINIPTQIPTLVIQQQNLTKICYQASNQLQGICIVDNADLVNFSNKTIRLNITCIQTCTFLLQAYLNDVVTITFFNTYKISPKDDSLTIYQFEIATPISSFDQIKLQAQITALTTNISKGVEMYANVGNYGALLPNQQHYQYKAIPIYKGIGIDIAKDQLPKGTWIKIAIFTNSKIDITLTAEFSTGSIQQLTLGKLKYCFLPKKKEKSFILDLTSSLSDIENHDINLIALIYSGNPQIKLSFDQQFKKILQNYGVGGNLNYFLTAKLRKQHNFNGKIYIKAYSQRQAYFQIGTSINPTNYIYLQESITYLSFLEPLAIQNYIFDVYYDLAKGENAQKYLYFTVKIKAIQGGGYYASRICNQENISLCLLANSSQFNDKKFIKQAQELPGNILAYYSLYQIYLYAHVSQFKIIKNDSNSTRYRCRILMVGYNFNAYDHLEWALTTYSRLNSIRLSQGVPFKDMVYQDAYNYYQFNIPSNITDFEIFITVLSGDAKLVSSLIYKFPEILFTNLQGNDIRTNPSNIIRYNSSQVKDKLYIGVYGSSLAEYIINTIVHRHQEKSKVALMQKIQQMFQIKQKGEIDFGLKFSSQGLWVIQIIELFGTVQSKLITNKDIICENTLKCIFNATSKQQMTLTVKSPKKSKFTINYYLKSECRLFSLGSINFIEIQPNSTECIKFIIDSNSSIQISYSQNTIKSLSTNVRLELVVNDNSLGIFEENYRSLSKEEIQQFCRGNNVSAKSKSCILQINIQGDKKQRSQIQFSAISNEDPISLFDDRTIIFSRKLFKKESPAYFNYFSLSKNSPTFFIKSLNYQQFRLAFSWIEYTTYLNSTKQSQIYPSFPQKIDNVNSFALSYFSRNLEIQIPEKDNCDECLLLITLFAAESNKQTTLQLSITSQQQTIEIGQTIHKTLSKYSFTSYQLQKVQPSQKTILTLKDYKQGNACYKVSLHQKQSQSQIQYKGNEILLPQDNKKYELQVKSIQNNCKIQIIYWSADVPVRIIQAGKSYSLQINNSSSAYFIYYHQVNKSFHLFQSIKSGYLYFYATPLIDNLQDSLMKDKFVFGTSLIYVGIQIDPSNSNFCFNCYYLIKIVGAPDAKGSIGVVDSFTPVKLNSDEVIREKVEEGEIRYYSFTADYPFKVKVNVVFGQILVKVTDRNDAQIYSQIIKDSRQINLNPTIFAKKYGQYLINITTKKQTIYSLQIIDTAKVRLIQGYPLSYNFIAQQKYQLNFQFLSGQQFNLLIIIDQQNPPNLNLSLTVQSQSQDSKNTTVFNSSYAGNIYSYDIRGKPSNYLISVTPTKAVKVKLLISRSNLTYLQPNTNTLSKNNTIYQIFSSGTPIMLELFSCKGDIQLTASTNYPSISNQKSSEAISLQHSNIGGHYVVYSNSSENQIYALVTSRTELPPLFVVKYTFVGILPYQYFDIIQRNIQYTVSHNEVEIKFQIPSLVKKDQRINNVKARFNLIVGDKSTDFNALMQCGMGTSLFSQTNQISSLPPVETQEMSYKIPRQQLKNFFKNEIQTFYVGIILKISYNQNQQPRQLTYIYQTLQVSLLLSSLITQKGQQSKTAFIFFWIIIPVLMGGGIAYLSLAYCIKRLRMVSFRNNQLMEEEEESNVPAISNKQEVVQEKA